MAGTGRVRFAGGRAACVVVAFALAAGCEPGDPCAEYVDYMCTCHGVDTGVDCEALAATYEQAGPAVQDECAVLLDEQESADQAAGEVCEV